MTVFLLCQLFVHAPFFCPSNAFPCVSFVFEFVPMLSLCCCYGSSLLFLYLSCCFSYAFLLLSVRFSSVFILLSLSVSFALLSMFRCFPYACPMLFLWLPYAFDCLSYAFHVPSYAFPQLFLCSFAFLVLFIYISYDFLVCF